MRRLDLAVNAIGDEGARLLASTPALAGLEDLSLHQVGLTDAGARALAASEHLPAGLSLCLFDNYALTAGAVLELKGRFAQVWAVVRGAE